MMFMLFFSIFFVCHAVILLIPCVIPLWDSAAAHSPSGKELNPSSQEDARFSGRCTLAYNFQFILRHPSLGLSNSSPILLIKSIYAFILFYTICDLFLKRKTAAVAEECSPRVWWSQEFFFFLGKNFTKLFVTLGVQTS